MKKLILHSVLFLLPLLIVIAIIPVDKRLKYKELKDDCLNKGIWIHDRIHINTSPIDIAFLGSSHTINAIDEAVIESQLADSNLEVANFGYCRLGRNLSLELLKQIALKKNPKKIFIEVREDENIHSHPIAPYILPSSSFLNWTSWIHKNGASDFWKHLTYTTQLTQDKYFNRIDSLHVFPWNHYHKSASDTAKSLSYKQIALAKDGHLKYIYPKTYIKQMASFCKKEGIEFIFLYLPNYGYGDKAPLHQAFYKEYGELWLPPKKLLNDKDLWYDSEHLNTAGAQKLSLWIADQLNR